MRSSRRDTDWPLRPAVGAGQQRFEMGVLGCYPAFPQTSKEGRMAFKDRIELVKRIEGIRGSTVICYLTSLRPGVPSAISDDAVRVFFDHLILLPARPIEKLDI